MCVCRYLCNAGSRGIQQESWGVVGYFIVRTVGQMGAGLQTPAVWLPF